MAGAQPAAKTPAITLLDSGDAPQWQNWTKELGWQVIAPTVPAGADIETRVQAVAAAVEQAIAKSGADPAHLPGALGEEGASLFYAISREPDLWAAGLVLGGSPQAALDTGRIYAVNFTLTPVLWSGTGANDQALAAKLQSAGMNLEFHPPRQLPWPRSSNGSPGTRARNSPRRSTARPARRFSPAASGSA